RFGLARVCWEAGPPFEEHQHTLRQSLQLRNVAAVQTDQTALEKDSLSSFFSAFHSSLQLSDRQLSLFVIAHSATEREAQAWICLDHLSQIANRFAVVVFFQFVEGDLQYSAQVTKRFIRRIPFSRFDVRQEWR